MGVKRVYYDWDDINKLLDIIHEQCKEEVSYVAGVPRGGTILAILYSHRFDIPYMEYISNHYPHMLILDDISDSGKTFEKLKKEETLKGFSEAILSKQRNKKIPFFYLGPENDWKKILDEKIQTKLSESFKDNLKELLYI